MAQEKAVENDWDNDGYNQKKFKRFIESDWWYYEHPLITESSNGRKMKLNFSVSRQIYISYKEPNLNFSIPPQNPVYLPKRKIICRFEGIISEDLSATLLIIGYKNNQKRYLFKVEINQNTILDLDENNFDCYRIAIHLKGKGEFSFNKITLGNDEIKGFMHVDKVTPFPDTTCLESRTSLSVKEDKVTAGSKIINGMSDLIIDFNEDIINVELKDIFLQPIDQKYFSFQDNYLISYLPNKRYSYLSINEKSNLYEPPTNKEKQHNFDSDHFYRIEFSAQKENSITMDLIILGFSGYDPLEVKSIPLGSNKLVKFNKNTHTLKFLIRLKGQGKFSNLKIDINKKLRKPLSTHEVQLHPHEWFNPQPSNIELIEMDHSLFLNTNIPLEKKFYISYKIKNNSFSRVPDQTIFDVNPNNYYEVTIDCDNNDNGIVSPVIVGYSEREKVEILNLELNKINYLNFNSNVVKCRLAFALSGINRLKIKKLIIKEFEDTKLGGEMNWIDPKEVSFLGLQEKKLISKVKVAAIFDEFTKYCFNPECNLITFTPDNWREKLFLENPDFLMVESAWHGNNGSWTKKIQYTDESSIKDLKEVIKWCRENNIPTVFWNKEDPIHYNHFIETAKLFDYIFTTDCNMLSKYRQDCKHNRVDTLQFAAQPTIHNPLSIGCREKAICFAGSYYSHHNERSKDMLKIFNQAIPYGLVIYDRNHKKVKKGLLKNNKFPDYLNPYIRGDLKYYEIDKAYKGFWAMININTVKDSPTMFARRVFEGLACGTPIISNYSKGVRGLFGDIICVSEDEKEIALALEQLFNNEQEYRQVVLKGIRNVLTDHTYAHRLEKIIKVLGLPFYKKEKEVIIFAKAPDLDTAKIIIESYINQDYKYKQLYIIIENDIREKIEINDFSIKTFTSEEFHKSYQTILDSNESPYIAVMSSNTFYDRNYLSDLIISTQYAPWEIICSESNRDLKFEQVTNFQKYQSIFKRDLFSIHSPEEFIRFLDEQSFGIEQFFKRGARVLAITTK
ncbi:glycosyltransferase family protein [Priestia megaterium]|uniref:glycosyltransferase family protein n=1 Tax=Priestia megaterium TaxID=1404 RepID=UPI0004715BA7|nr:glycosyltransferase [Priestia megaterium]